MSELFKAAWAKTHAVEGGYSNHPSDPGGETNHGITMRVAREHGYFGPMIDLPVEIAVEIAKKEYWDKLMLDDVAKLSAVIANELFDTNFNMWYGAAVKFLQRALNGLNRGGRDYADLGVDGRIGNVTLGALNSFLLLRKEDGEQVLLALLNAQQACDYLRQTTENPEKEDFLFGWTLQRVAKQEA